MKKDIKQIRRRISIKDHYCATASNHCITVLKPGISKKTVSDVTVTLELKMTSEKNNNN